MNSTDTFCANESEVAHDTIDGEVIAVNFQNGRYFSLRESAARIWHWLVDGHSVSKIVSHLRATCQDADIAAVESFIRELTLEGLLAPCDDPPEQLGDLSGIEKGECFLPPEMTKYDDMEELLLLDPVHEVNATGWPNKAA